MDDSLFGLLFLVICLALGWAFVRYFKRERIALLCVLLLALCTRVFISSDRYLHTWDERYHALVAKNLVHDPLNPVLYKTPLQPYDHKNWVANHVWLEKGPVALWAMAVSIFAFGTVEWAVRFPSLIFSLLAVWLTYKTGKLLFDSRTGLLAALLHAINGLVSEVAGGRVSSDHVETCFDFLIELALFLVVVQLVRKSGWKYALFAGVVTGLAFLTKWTPALLVFPVWLIAGWNRTGESRKALVLKVAAAFAVCCCVVLPWLIYIRVKFPLESLHVMQKFVFAYADPVEAHTGPWFYYFKNLGMVFGEVVWIAFGVVLLKKKTGTEGWKFRLLNLWWMLPFLLFSFAATKRLTYMLIAAPAIFILVAYAWWWFRAVAFRPKWIVALVLTLLIGLPVRYWYERTKPFTSRNRSPAWAEALKALNGKYGEKTVFFGSDHPIEGMFYTPYIFYNHLPEPAQVTALESEGYQVLIPEK